MPDKFTPWYLFSTVLVAICWSLIHLILDDYTTYSERQFLRFAAYTVHEWKGLSVAGPAALFTHKNDNVCWGSHCTLTNWKDAVLWGPLHYSPIETTARWTSHCTLRKWKGPCVAGPSQMERTVCCGSLCTIHKRKRQCVAGLHGTIHKRKVPCVAGPAALFKTERTVCCGAHGSIHKWKGRCVGGPFCPGPHGQAPAWPPWRWQWPPDE